MKPKVLIDLSTFKGKPQCSMDIYSIRLLKGLMMIPLSYEIILLINEESYSYLRALFPNFKYLLIKNFKNTNIFQRIFKYASFKNQACWKKAISKSHADLLLCPYTDLDKISNLKIFRLQVIHDIHGKYVTKGKEKFKQTLLMPILLKKSDAIITISDFVKEEIKKQYPYCVSSKHIYRIYNSIDYTEEFANYPLKSHTYILYVNAIREYKNIITLIKAFSLIKDEIKQNLVIIGKKNNYWDEEIVPFIKKNQLQNRIEQIDYATESQLNFLYKNASLFVSPSLYEGFGYTPIEAGIYKTPVITNNETSLPEVTLHSVFYYTPPTDEKALAQVIKKVINKPPTHEELTNLAERFREAYSLIKQASHFNSTILECLNDK